MLILRSGERLAPVQRWFSRAADEMDVFVVSSPDIRLLRLALATETSNEATQAEFRSRDLERLTQASWPRAEEPQVISPMAAHFIKPLRRLKRAHEHGISSAGFSTDEVQTPVASGSVAPLHKGGPRDSPRAGGTATAISTRRALAVVGASRTSWPAKASSRADGNCRATGSWSGAPAPSARRCRAPGRGAPAKAQCTVASLWQSLYWSLCYSGLSSRAS